MFLCIVGRVVCIRRVTEESVILKLERKFNWVVGLCLILIYFKVLQGLLVIFCLRGFICLLQWNGMGALWRSECMVAVAVRVHKCE